MSSRGFHRHGVRGHGFGGFGCGTAGMGGRWREGAGGSPMSGPAGGWRDDRLTGSPNPHRLFKDPENGVIFGVCAGLAAYFGLQVWQVRVAAVVSLLIFMPQTILAYLVLAAILPRRPAQLYRTPEEEEFWRSVSGTPRETFSALRHRFRDFDERIAAMERTVTSNEFKLDRDIRNLDR